jgi:cytosine deaminase
MNLDGYGLRVGDRADLVVLPCQHVAAAVTELAQPVLGFKRGRQSFMRPPTRLNHPHSP